MASNTGQSNPDRELLLASLEHCTKWVEFRTSHQVQSFNGYLIAVGFLAAGYFAAVSAHLKLLAVGITITGLLASIAFAYAVVRLAKYVDVGEDALWVLEARLATLINAQEINMVERAKRDRTPLLSRRLFAIGGYAVIVAVWVAAAVFAIVQP